MVSILNLETGKIDGPAMHVGCASIEDFLDIMYDKYTRLVNSKKYFLSGGIASINWIYVGGDLMVKSISVEYNGDGKEVELANSILYNWIFCNLLNFAKILGGISVTQRKS